VQVTDRVIRLKDVALVESDNPSLLTALEGVDVGSAPLIGHSREVSADFARVRIRRVGIDLDRLKFGGAQLVKVTRPDQSFAGDAIAKAACDAVEAAQPGTTVRATTSPSDLRLPLGKVELKTGEPRIAGRSTGTIPVQVAVDGRVETTVTVSFRVLRQAPVVVAARDVLPGTVLTEEDVSVEERPMTTGPLLLGEATLAVGQQAAVPIRRGTPLTSSMLRAPVLVKRGERVKLICRGHTFTATAGGEALQDGVLGRPVRVRNLSSLLDVTGIVTGAQVVEVAF
jgi:flagella basal body P-ring formation protein FlgA